LKSVFDEMDGLEVGSAELTPSRMYLKLVSPRLMADVKVNDPVQAGVVLSNSEVGCGAVSIDLMVYRLVCTNGAIVGSGVAKTRRYHIGKALRGGDGNYGIGNGDYGNGHQGKGKGNGGYQLVMEEATDAIFWEQVREAVRETLRDEHFQGVVAQMRASTQQCMESAPQEVSERLATRYGLGEVEREGVLFRLLESDELTQFGLANAVTRYSQEVLSYVRATELERLGGHLLQLSPGEWKGLSSLN